MKKDIHTIDYRAPYEERRIASSFIDPAGRLCESLNGDWVFTEDSLSYVLRGEWYRRPGGKRPQDYDFEHGGKMAVPSCWNLAKESLLHYDSMGIYTRHFAYSKKDGRVFLSFEGLAYRGYVFLNEHYLGFHDGASTPFSIEVTDYLEEDNFLLVAVDAERRDDRVPMSNTDWFNYGGIYRDVYLLHLPKDYIRKWSLSYDMDGTEINVQVEVSTAGEPVQLRIPALGLECTLTSQDGYRKAIKASPKLWSPQEPELYDIELVYKDDIAKDRVGFRDIRVSGGRILLNGKESFLRGICLHEDDPVLGKSTNEESIRATIATVKNELNADFIRLSHYPHSRLFARLADEMGVLLWEEIPVYWAVDFASNKAYEDAQNQLAELIERDINRASVIIWSVGNENPDTDERLSFMTRLAEKARALDDSRLVAAACLVDEERETVNDRLIDALDVIGVNEYYGWYSYSADKLVRVMSNSKLSKPVIITETGAEAKAGFHDSDDVAWSEERQAAYYRAQLEAIDQCPTLSGMTPWLLYDFRSERRMNRYQEGYNRKGLIDEWRKHKKLAFDVLASYYAKRKKA